MPVPNTFTVTVVPEGSAYVNDCPDAYAFPGTKAAAPPPEDEPHEAYSPSASAPVPAGLFTSPRAAHADAWASVGTGKFPFTLTVLVTGLAPVTWKYDEERLRPVEVADGE